MSKPTVEQVETYLRFQLAAFDIDPPDTPLRLGYAEAFLQIMTELFGDADERERVMRNIRDLS